MVATLILAAGQGKRMVSDLPKILHPVGGKPMVHHVIDTALALSPTETVVVISPTLDAAAVKGQRLVSTAIQKNALGSGDAARVGLEALSNLSQTVMILCGDTPLLEAHALAELLKQHESFPTAGITVVGMRPSTSNAYGRIVADASGQIERIVEWRDATDVERTIPLCNSGVIVADGALLKSLVAQLSPQNEAGEYYLTEVVGIAFEQGIPSRVVELSYESLRGINNRVDLAEAQKAMQNRWRHRFMEEGVTLIDPSSVFFASDTKIGRDVTISPNVTFGPGVVIGDRAHILPGCHIENSTIGADVSIGPFAHLRDGVVLGDQVSIGNFVEIKGTTIGAGTKAKHLSYLGNATIGEGVNIGAGTITCNHNGFVKSQTLIGARAYIGSQTCLVAPVAIGAGAIVAAGSVVSENVPEDALGIARQRQENKLEWAAKFRNRFKR
jgi:bifunctional UDP-N-acetylglucosamine pyrophosphorylase/glucosamine-1-phosphate N-acetyltransferase